MRPSFAARGGFTLMKTPSAREQAARRRWAIIGAMASLAIASGLIGAVLQPAPEPAATAATGPFSYIPSQ